MTERAGRIKLNVAFAAEREMVTDVDQVARTEGSSRSDAIRKLLRLGLERYERQARLVEALEAASERVAS